MRPVEGPHPRMPQSGISRLADPKRGSTTFDNGCFVSYGVMMRWKTYTPDGRTLEVGYVDGTWIASCDSGRGEAETAAEAIEQSLGESVTLIGASRGAIEEWVAQQAARLESERDAS
jgi:hypothetical protein